MHDAERLGKALFGSITALPARIDQDEPAGGVLRPWVRALPLRHQGVLVTAIRGCDGAPKEDDSKALVRMVRRAILNPADVRETAMAGGFFGYSPEKLAKGMHGFLHSLDQYPLHYVTHLLHASEVIGYLHPDTHFSGFFIAVYETMCFSLHVRPELRHEMHERLTADRVALGLTEENFTLRTAGV